jgi:putative transposase
MSTKGRKHRRSIRLPGFDYSQPGAYFVTICSYRRKHLFGEVIDGEVALSVDGRSVREEWFNTADIRKNVTLLEDEFVIMPNHIHGIIHLEHIVGHGAAVPLH